jgi:hypothetical protein
MRRRKSDGIAADDDSAKQNRAIDDDAAQPSPCVPDGDKWYRDWRKTPAPFFGQDSQFTSANWTPSKNSEVVSAYIFSCHMSQKKLSVKAQWSKYNDTKHQIVVWKIYFVFWASNSHDTKWRDHTVGRRERVY